MAKSSAKATSQPTSEVKKWLGIIKDYDTEFEKWQTRTQKIIDRYRDEKRIGTDQSNKAVRFNILWSNVQTLVPATFSRLPQPDISRRFSDNDPVGRVSSLILERALEFEVQHYPDYRAMMAQSVLDRFLGGRGTCWARYEPHVKAAEKGVPEDGVQITEDADDPEEQLDYECAPTDYVHWRDFGHTVARTWEEVTAGWRWVYMTRDACVKRFGKEKGSKIPLDAKPEDLKRENQTPDTETTSRAAICEIWDKTNKEAIWLSKSMKEIIDRKPDPLDLEEFFPFPKPLFSTQTNETLVPVPDFTLYQDQANELDLLADRIDGLVKALQVKGVYDASLGIEIARLFTESDNTDLKPVKNWQAFAEKNGLKGAIDLIDLTPIAKALEQAYLATQQIKNQIYEIMSISDIVRGATDPRETLGAQKLKGQYASMRLKHMQMQVAQYATDALRLKAQIICSFDPETIKKMASVEALSEEDQQFVPDALLMLKNAPARNFRIEIAADSLVQVDEQELKESRVEFLTSVGVFIDKIGPMVQQAPQLAPLAMKLLKFGVTAFKAGKTVEGAIDHAADQLLAMAGKPQVDPAEMEKQITEKVTAQVKQEQAIAHGQKEIALNNRAATLDIRELKLEADKKVSEQARLHAEDNTVAKIEDEFNRWKVTQDNETKIEVAEIQAKASLDAAQIKSAEEATDQVNDELGDDGGAVDAAKATRKARVKPIEKLTEMHGQQMAAHGETAKALAEVAKALAARKRIIRDPATGKAAGVETVQETVQ